jgi:cytochrome b pre-mRNA-processing protein 3
VFTWLKNRAEDRRTAIDLYGAIVTQARAADLFAVHGAQDTPEGRTSMIIALMCPVLERLAAEGPPAGRLARYLTETFVTDVDDSLREMGVGDLSVPKKVKRAAQALGERCLAYRKAAQSADPEAAVAAELAMSVPGLGGNEAQTRLLANRILAFHSQLSAVDVASLAEGASKFPAARTPPEALADAGGPA